MAGFYNYVKCGPMQIFLEGQFCPVLAITQKFLHNSFLSGNNTFILIFISAGSICYIKLLILINISKEYMIEIYKYICFNKS